MQDFAARLIAWQLQQGRHDLPWQVKDPYRIWLSEIMLQQTQVETVIPYYLRFLDRFPDIPALARVGLDDVLALWSGLGYYARARNLHAAARVMLERHGGGFPRDFEDILALPGVGRSTAAAIAVFAHGERRAILDGNVKRVLCRIHGIEGWPGTRSVEEGLWRLAEDLLPETDIGVYTQGLMDLGATLCRRGKPDCPKCPFEETCVANSQGRQGELPAARPRKAIPERTTRMLIALNAGAVLLEKRPPSGVWGGMWSLPEGDAAVGADTMARSLGLEVVEARELPPMLHVLSHFRLHILPGLVHVRQPSSCTREPGLVWLDIEDVRDAALPAPVRVLLEGLKEA
jgi:A/G-specific adenine glycosylase